MIQKQFFRLVILVGSTALLFFGWELFLDITGNRVGQNIAVNEINPQILPTEVEAYLQTAPDLPPQINVTNPNP